MADEEDIGIIVIEKARYIFEKLGCEDDFCIQYVGGSSVVFGGVNRLLWTPRFGFKLDPASNPEFVAGFRGRFQLGG